MAAKPELDRAPAPYTPESQGGYAVSIGLTNIAKAIMYAADTVASAISRS